jgi:hypothetical protein
MALDSSGALYISACKSLFVIDTATNSVRDGPVQFDSDIEDIKVSSDGYLYLLFSRAIELVDSQSWEVIERADLNRGRALDVAVANEHGKVYVLRDDESVEVFSTDLDRLGSIISLPNKCSSIVGMSGRDIYLREQNGGVLVLNMDSEVIASIILPGIDK